MSFGEEWVLRQRVDSFSNDDLRARVAAILPEGVTLKVTGKRSSRTIQVTFGADAVETLAAKLASRPGQLDWDWRKDIEAPPGGSYEVFVELVKDELPLVRVSSNDGDNRQAWPIAFAIASSLAEDLGVLSDDEEASMKEGALSKLS